jgi:hypothetical protein
MLKRYGDKALDESATRADQLATFRRKKHVFEKRNQKLAVRQHPTNSVGL